MVGEKAFLKYKLSMMVTCSKNMTGKLILQPDRDNLTQHKLNSIKYVAAYNNNICLHH